jgi:hypothetical protein
MAAGMPSVCYVDGKQCSLHFTTLQYRMGVAFQSSELAAEMPA